MTNTLTLLREEEIEWARQWLTDNHDELAKTMDKVCPGLEREYIENAVAQLWERLVNRLMEDHGFDRKSAERFQAAGLTYLLYERRNPTAAQDIGWHNLQLYSAEYAAICLVAVGRYVHHLPNDVKVGKTGDGKDATAAAKCYSCSDGGCRQGRYLRWAQRLAQKFRFGALPD